MLAPVKPSNRSGCGKGKPRSIRDARRLLQGAAAPATSMSDLINLSETTVVKANSAFCVALRDGRLPLEGDHPLGLYLDDCRHLRGHELRLGGRLLRLLSASDASGAGAAFELTNPELELDAGRRLPVQSVRVRLERRISSGAMIERILLRSHARDRIELDLELRLDA